MTNTVLLISIVFASLFGFFTICFAMWCVGCYMHRHFQYLHTLSLQRAQPTPVVCIERHSSRDEKNARGRRPEYRDCEQGRIRDGDQRPMMQYPIQAHHEPQGQPYRPSLKRKDRVQNIQPMMQKQLPMHWQTQGTLHTSPLVMRSEMAQQPSRQMAPGTSKPDQGLPRYQTQGLFRYHRPHEESVGSEAAGARELKNFSVRGQPPAKHASQARRVDYIHICDEYPPIVLQALKKATPASPTTASSASSSSSSSNGSRTTLEIPRTDVAHAKPDYVTSSPTQFPQCHHFATGARDLSR